MTERKDTMENDHKGIVMKIAPMLGLCYCDEELQCGFCGGWEPGLQRKVLIHICKLQEQAGKEEHRLQDIREDLKRGRRKYDKAAKQKPAPTPIPSAGIRRIP